MQEFDKQRDAPPIAEAVIHKENLVHRILVWVLLLVMVGELLVLLIDKSWISAFLVTLIITTLLSPVIFRTKLEMEIVGFLLVYLLNESMRINLHMTPEFISLFAFLFAITIGTLWEIFEFFMDQFFGHNMQKPMMGDPSGLTDTMWDMIVNAIGALIISFMGWWYLKRKRTFL